MKTEFSERYITLGLKIAYYRKTSGYTQEAFAEMIDKSVSLVGFFFVPRPFGRRTPE